MGLVLQYKRGELSKDDVSPEIVTAADSMSTKDVEDFASTDHNNLPDKITAEQNFDNLRKIIRKEVIQNIKEGNYNRDMLSGILASGKLFNEIRVDTDSYVASHGKKPRQGRGQGGGQWAFEIDGKEVFIDGTLSQATKEAKKRAKSAGVYSIKVLP